MADIPLVAEGVVTRLKASGIVVTRGGKRILDGVSFECVAPSLVAVIGPNGAGKSTLLTALAGIEKPEQGDVSLGDSSVFAMDRRALARRRAYLPQNARCEWPISVERVVMLGLTPTLPAFGDLPSYEKTRVANVLSQYDLTDKREQAATTLSGGELARTMLARAAVSDPELLIADEPTAGLDPRHAIDAMKRLKELSAKGRLVIVALHDLALAARYADRVIAIKDGRIIAAGAIDEVFTPQLLRELFDVDVRVDRDSAGLSISFIQGTV